jgi:hypothetical protein
MLTNYEPSSFSPRSALATRASFSRLQPRLLK